MHFLFSISNISFCFSQGSIYLQTSTFISFSVSLTKICNFLLLIIELPYNRTQAFRSFSNVLTELRTILGTQLTKQSPFSDRLLF